MPQTSKTRAPKPKLPDFSKKTTSDPTTILRRMLKIFALGPQTWTKNSFGRPSARARRYIPIWDIATSPELGAVCLLGAAKRASGRDDGDIVVEVFLNTCISQIPGQKYVRTANFNDDKSTKFEDIVKVTKCALGKANTEKRAAKAGA